MTALSIDHLSIAYGDAPAVTDVSLAVAAGQIVALIGESGSGKSSIALAIAGLLPEGASMHGSIRYGGGIGIVFQDPLAALNPALTIGYQIGEAWRGDRRERKAAVRAAMEEVGLDVPPGRYPHQISGGQRQRAMIAMALIGAPALLIADEPTAALDPTSRARIAALLADVARRRGMGLLLITHDLALAATWADRIVELDRGRIVREIGPAELAPAPEAGGTAEAVKARPVLARMTGVTRRYGGVVAVADVSLEIRVGETLGIVGESGAGKTSLARIMLGLDRPDAGGILIGGVSPATAKGDERRRLRRRVQAVFQDPAASFDPLYTVARIIAEPLFLLDPKPARSEVERLVRDALVAVELAPELGMRRAAMLSGGQQQRVALARALVIGPDLVVLDEALSALDARLRGEMIALLRRLQRERGVAYLLIGHDFAVMRAMADRLVVLRAGRVVETGVTADLLDHPRGAYTAALIAASPTLAQALAARSAS